MASANSHRMPSEESAAQASRPPIALPKQPPGTAAASGVKIVNSAQRNVQQGYQRSLVETASPARLIVLLYDGAIRFCSLALEAMPLKDFQTQHTNLIKAQRIIAELMGSLDRKSGGEVADNLFRVYAYMLEQLVLGNLADSIEPVQLVQKMLYDLRDTWIEVERNTAPGAAPERAAPEASVNRPASAPRLGECSA